MALPDASFLEEEGHQGHLYEGIVNLYWNISRGATEAIVFVASVRYEAYMT